MKVVENLKKMMTFFHPWPKCNVNQKRKQYYVHLKTEIWYGLAETELIGFGWYLQISHSFNCWGVTRMIPLEVK